jgi:hypothetical protein
MNPYSYVSNNPLSNVDPLGLYQSDIHFYMTFFLAMASGVDYDAARTMALAAQYVDNNPQTRPLDESNLLTIMASPLWNQNQLSRYHFVLWETSSTGHAVFSGNTDVSQHSSTQLSALLAASTGAPTGCSKLQLFGEYLHAFQDTFAHRDKHNVPYGVNNGFGHGLSAGSNPDYTFNDPYAGNDPVVLANIWSVREARTLKMEEDVFAEIQRAGFGAAGRVKTWAEVRPVVEQFNRIMEHEGDNFNFVEKLDLLNSTLASWGYTAMNSDGTARAINLGGSVDAYDAHEGAVNRNKNLCDQSGNRLPQGAGVGAIMPTGPCP